VLPAIRYGVRPAPRRRPVADLLLGVSKRRRSAAYLAIGGGVKLLQPMLRRAAILLGVLVAVPLASIWLRLVF
jgi:hypothetical protein